MSTSRRVYWGSLGGDVQCSDHTGYEASAAERLRVSPRLRRIETSMTVWHRLTSADVAEWVSYLVENGEAPEACDGCRWIARQGVSV